MRSAGVPSSQGTTSPCTSAGRLELIASGHWFSCRVSSAEFAPLADVADVVGDPENDHEEFQEYPPAAEHDEAHQRRDYEQCQDAEGGIYPVIDIRIEQCGDHRA